jgi:hypothetical protein
MHELDFSQGETVASAVKNLYHVSGRFFPDPVVDDKIVFRQDIPQVNTRKSSSLNTDPFPAENFRLAEKKVTFLRELRLSALLEAFEKLMFAFIFPR